MQTQPAVVEQQVNRTPVVVWLTFTLLRVSMAMGSFPRRKRAGVVAQCGEAEGKGQWFLP